MKSHVYTVRYGLTKGLKRKGGLGFIPQIIEPTEEEKFLMNLDLTCGNVYDIGGGYGLFTIFFARAVGKPGKVVTFEPNPMLYNKIIENVNLNCFNNVEVRQIAVGKEGKKETLAFPPGELGIGSMEQHEKSRILSLKGAKTVEVEVDSLDHQIATGNLPRPDLVKIDVQGLELAVLLGMSKTIQKYKPKILVEVHYVPYINWKIRNLQRVVEFLIANGYSIYHVESGRMITLYNAQIVEADEHLYCI